HIRRRRPPPDLQHSSPSDWTGPMEPQFLPKRNGAADELLYDHPRYDWGGVVDEPICSPARRRVSPVAAQRGGDPAGSVGAERLEDGGQLREAGADRLSRFQRRVERQARCQAEGMLERERSSPKSAPRTGPVPITLGP